MIFESFEDLSLPQSCRRAVLTLLPYPGIPLAAGAVANGFAPCAHVRQYPPAPFSKQHGQLR